jgi:hypothetical protein
VRAGKRKGLVAAAVVLTLSGSVAALAATPADAPRTAPSPLVEAVSCSAPAPVTATPAVATDGPTVVSIEVPALTRLRVEGGTVVAASTNTGCAPRSSDRFVVGARLATAAEAAPALAVRTGDWTVPGSWHRLR